MSGADVCGAMSGGARLDDAAVGALQDVLATEHAALWSYSLAVAFLARPGRRRADGHRGAPHAAGRRRGDPDQVGQRPVSAQPAYTTPQPVVDAKSAAGLLVTAETDAAAAWRSLLERGADRALRRAGLDALTDTAAAAPAGVAVVGAVPAVPVFPGRPDPGRAPERERHRPQPRVRRRGRQRLARRSTTAASSSVL